MVATEVHTPEVPYGSCFHNELQYATSRIDDSTCRLRISHHTVFVKKTILRSAIEAGAEKVYSAVVITLVNI